jgi:RNA polymerase sigma-70 factor, ECF subfamily
MISEGYTGCQVLVTDTATTRGEAEATHDLVLPLYGILPNLFRVQNELPKVVQAEEQLIHAILLTEGSLSRDVKHGLLSVVARARRNNYCWSLHSRNGSEHSDCSSLLGRAAVKLASTGCTFSADDVGSLLRAGFNVESLLDVILTVALGQLLCTLSEALDPELEFEPRTALDPLPLPQPALDASTNVRPYLTEPPRRSFDFAPYATLRDTIGFIPSLFHAQGSRPDVIEAEVNAIEQIVVPEEHLSRTQKEATLLVLAAANANAYCVALQTQILAALGTPEDEIRQLTVNLRQASLSSSDFVLYEETKKLSWPVSGNEFSADRLRSAAFSSAQIFEACATAALGNFFATLQFGTGCIPDFAPEHVFTPKDLYRFAVQVRPISDVAAPDDPDSELVRQTQSGNKDAFEELVRRHNRRIFGTLAGILGDLDDARDATQEAFLKAFEHIGRFEGRSKFSTWLTSIAVNNATETLRRRKPTDSLDDIATDEDFRPRQVQQWERDPEEILSATQRNTLVREAVSRLPYKYRVAVLLRDISQFSTEDAATTLGLSVPALKARVLRGRLMLRESLAVHFVRPEKPNA